MTPPDNSKLAERLAIVETKTDQHEQDIQEIKSGRKEMRGWALGILASVAVLYLQGYRFQPAPQASSPVTQSQSVSIQDDKDEMPKEVDLVGLAYLFDESHDQTKRKAGKGEFPASVAYKVGREWRFNTDNYKAWIATQRGENPTKLAIAQ